MYTRLTSFISAHEVWQQFYQDNAVPQDLQQAFFTFLLSRVRLFILRFSEYNFAEQNDYSEEEIIELYLKIFSLAGKLAERGNAMIVFRGLVTEVSDKLNGIKRKKKSSGLISKLFR